VAVLFRFARENVKQPMDMAGSIVANKNAPVIYSPEFSFLENLHFYIKCCIIYTMKIIIIMEDYNEN
jgi:hypothetical protein